jgi:serine/threonine protein kinase
MPEERDPESATLASTRSMATGGPKSVTLEPDLVGAMVGGRYLIEQKLGRGGIGAVYLARDKPELMSRRVVVKVLLADSLKDEWIVRKFRQEVESLTRLDDPGVVGIFDAGALPDGAPYLVMQFVDGVSLRAEVRPGGMDFKRAADIIHQVGRTIAVAHVEGVIHRDLKPENIMLRVSAAGEIQVKVIDFGIAKVKNSVVAPSTITGAGVAGTIGYMSPEQLDARKVTPASDVYALGVIAYEMLTGIRPFNPETAFQLLEMQRNGPRVGPKDLRPALSEAAQEIIFKALAFEPGERYQHVREFSESLARALTGEPAMLEVSTLKRHDSKTVDSDDKQSSSSGPRAFPLPEKFKRRKNQSFPLLAVAAALLVIVIGGALILRARWKQSNRESRSDVATAGATRTLTYSLTVQKMVKDEKTTQYKPLGDQFNSTGQEIYGNGWEFHLNITPAEAGSLYLLNEGAGANDETVYHVLFPTPANNNGVARLASGQTMQTSQYFFNEYKGTEKLWIIWSAQPVTELESIFKDAAKNKLVINGQAQIDSVRNLLTHYGSVKPEVQSDKSKRQTTLKGTGDVLVSLLELQHEQY